MKSTLSVQVLLRYHVFVENLRKHSQELTRRELIIAVLLRAGLSSSEIAARIHCSVRTVENHRFRLRRKLKLDASVNLTDFMLGVEGENPMLFYWLEKIDLAHHSSPSEKSFEKNIGKNNEKNNTKNKQKNE